LTVYGSYATIEDTPTLIFERRLSHPVDRVWEAITDPDVLIHWFPCAVDVDLRPGGAMEFTFAQDVLPDGSNSMPGEVTELDPPRVFAFAWGEDHLRFELQPVAGGAGCELRLTVGLGTRDKAARDSAGWHVCLDRLEGVLAGDDGPTATGASGEWRTLYEEYQRRGAPAGAAVPGE
jgi:uncharacterized protein YndB with AHSA1/START domain